MYNRGDEARMYKGNREGCPYVIGELCLRGTKRLTD